MARRNRKKKAKSKQAKQNAAKPSARLEQAIQLLKQGKLEDADLLAQNVVKRVSDGDLLGKAQQVLAESAFRQAAVAMQPEVRLSLLDRALEQTPNDARLHYHRGLTLWRVGNYVDAPKEFDWVATHDPQRLHASLLQQVAQLVHDSPANESDLSPDEAQFLQLVQSFVNDAPKEQIAAQLKSAPLLPAQYLDLWLALLDMRDKPKTASTKTISRLTEATLVNPIADYYRGVAALRKKEYLPALDAWQSAAQRGASQAWFNDNRSNLLREQTSEMAQEDRWQEIVEISEGQVNPDGDKILNETVAAAHFHLGYSAVQTSNWSLALSHWQQANDLKLSRQLAQNLALAYENEENWSEAGKTWRETVRRRPRKENHPDYLSDSQVATIWTRAAMCYARAEMEAERNYYPLYEEKLTCLKNAIKYAPTNMDLRMKLVNTYLEEEREDAAEKELERILDADPDHVSALLRLGVLYHEQWGKEPLPLWERALALEPNNVDARNAVVESILADIDDMSPSNWFARLNPLSDRDKLKKLKAAAKQVPNHPKLLFELGLVYRKAKKHKDAVQALTESWNADAKDPQSFGRAMHELLHVKGGDKVVEEKIPEIHTISALLPSFWTNQAESVITCKLDERWVIRFWDEAIMASEQNRTPETLAFTLVSIMESSLTEGVPHLAEKYEARLRSEVPNSGAVEFLEAISMREDEADPKEMVKLLRRAGKKARAAGESEMAEKIEFIVEMLNNPFSSLLGGLGDLGPFSDDDFDMDPEELLDELFKDLGRRR